MTCSRTSVRGECVGGFRHAPLAAMVAALACMLGGCSITLPGFSSVATVSSSPMTVSLRILKGADNSTLALAPVYIHGEGPYQFIVDTGASVSIMRREIARQLALPPAGSRQQVNGVGGTEQIAFVTISNWRADRLALPHGTIGSGTLPFNDGGSPLDGLLGSDVWSQFGKVTIDYAAATLTVYRSVADHADRPLRGHRAPVVTILGQAARILPYSLPQVFGSVVS